MATIHYDVTIQCDDAQDYAEQLAAVQTVNGATNVVSDATAHRITFELEHQTGT